MHNLDTYTTAQASRALGCSTRQVLRLVDRGDITPLAKLPGKTGAYLFDVHYVESLADARCTCPESWADADGMDDITAKVHACPIHGKRAER